MCLAECIECKDIYGPGHFERSGHSPTNITVGAECGNTEGCF